NTTTRTGCPPGSCEWVELIKKARTTSRCCNAARMSDSLCAAYISKWAEEAWTHLASAAARRLVGIHNKDAIRKKRRSRIRSTEPPVYFTDYRGRKYREKARFLRSIVQPPSRPNCRRRGRAPRYRGERRAGSSRESE